jgi:serine/threonine protein kinase
VTKAKVAIKKVGRVFKDLTDAKRIVREIKLMRHFEHENLVGIVDLLPPTRRDFRDLYIVSELMETDLHRIIHSRQSLSDDHVQYFVYQMLRGLKYMHSANVLHRDLKPSNILVNSNCDLKICDFGLARGVIRDGAEPLTEYVVTRWYRAPEIMLACREYTKAVDVWSVGCIMAELLGRKVLFAGRDYMDMLTKILDLLGSQDEEDYAFVTSKRARAWLRKHAGIPRKPLETVFTSANPKALDLLDKLLTFDPGRRITVEEALEHPYMASLHSVDDEPVCPAPFDFSWESHVGTKESLQDEIIAEVLLFHPEHADEIESWYKAEGRSLPKVEDAGFHHPVGASAAGADAASTAAATAAESSAAAPAAGGGGGGAAGAAAAAAAAGSSSKLGLRAMDV